MHFPQVVFAEADSAAGALAVVDESLLPKKNTFFGWDWYEVDGRVAGRAQEDGVFRADADPAETERVIQHMLDRRIAYMYRARAAVLDQMDDLLELVDGDPAIDRDRPDDRNPGYPLTHLGLALFKASYTHFSFIWDAEVGDAVRRYFDQRMASNPTRQWLVLLDVHN